MGAKLLHADGRTDGRSEEEKNEDSHDEANGRFSQFYEGAQKFYFLCSVRKVIWRAVLIKRQFDKKVLESESIAPRLLDPGTRLRDCFKYETFFLGTRLPYRITKETGWASVRGVEAAGKKEIPSSVAQSNPNSQFRPYSTPVESGLQSALNRHTVRLFTESDDTRDCNNTICPPEDEHSTARNLLRIIM